MRDQMRIERKFAIEVIDRTCDGIAIDVAACALRGHSITVISIVAIEMTNYRSEVVPAHIMELNALTRGQTKAAVSVAIGSLVEREPLLGGQLAAGRILEPHHKDEVANLLAALVARALLVDTEAFGDLLGLLANGFGFARAESVDFGAHRMPSAVGRLNV